MRRPALAVASLAPAAGALSVGCAVLAGIESYGGESPDGSMIVDATSDSPRYLCGDAAVASCTTECNGARACLLDNTCVALCVGTGNACGNGFSVPCPRCTGATPNFFCTPLAAGVAVNCPASAACPCATAADCVNGAVVCIDGGCEPCGVTGSDGLACAEPGKCVANKASCF